MAAINIMINILLRGIIMGYIKRCGTLTPLFRKLKIFRVRSVAHSLTTLLHAIKSSNETIIIYGGLFPVAPIGLLNSHPISLNYVQLIVVELL